MIIKYQGKKLDILPPWERISVNEALRQYAGFSIDEITDHNRFPRDKIAAIARKKGYNIAPKNTWEEIFNQIFLNEVEIHLGTHGKPTILYDYPRPLAALAREKPDDPRLSERFEFYIAGLELGDCYMEFSDAEDMNTRFRENLVELSRKGKPSIIPDSEFIDALRIGLPPCSGIAIGVDRLVMLFADAASIRDVLFFPMEDMIQFKNKK